MSAVPLESPIHVLLVEDHELLRKVIQRTLTSRGFQVTLATTGDEAAKLVEEGTAPDILLCDVRMPGHFNGLELARRLRLRDSKLAILLMTGFAEVDTGGFRVLLKPFDPRTLVTAIREALLAAGKDVETLPEH